jgi:Zn-dependent M28 family amino/carboxypeptidase
MLAAALGALAFYAKQPVLAERGAGRAVDASPERLRSDVERLVALSPRDAASPEGNDHAAVFVRDAFVEAGLEPTFQTFEVEDGARPSRNVVARVGPAEGPRVVVGAHYDACGALPGADDNASGVAALLELARMLAKHPPSGPVELVAYANEEPPDFATPAMGSVHHAEALARSGVEVKAMLCLEMVGYFDDAPGSQRYPVAPMAAIYPTRGDFIAVIGNVGGASLVRDVKRAMAGASPLSVESINAPEAIPGVDFSDHRSYWARGIPAVMVTDTAFYRNDRYHTARDLPDTLDYARMADVVAGVHAAVVALAEPQPRATLPSGRDSVL